jgi:type IV secretion system protein VirB1
VEQDVVLTLPEVVALADRCAPQVAVETLVSIATVESGLDPLAIGVNGAPVVRVSASTANEAAAKAQALIDQGRSVDLGLAQINSRNLPRLGLSVADAFEPCRNLEAAQAILVEDFGRSSGPGTEVQAALRASLSRYNTGDPERGLTNGYVARVVRAAVKIVPALQVDAASATSGSEPDAIAPPPPPAWDVFARAGPAAFVTHIVNPIGAKP